MTCQDCRFTASSTCFKWVSTSEPIFYNHSSPKEPLPAVVDQHVQPSSSGDTADKRDIQHESDLFMLGIHPQLHDSPCPEELRGARIRII